MYEGKKVLIFGLGLNDGGLGMAEYFLEHGAEVTITDKKTAEELSEPIKKLSKYENVTYHLGGHIIGDFFENDIIIRNPAIKPNNEYLKIARENGKGILMEMALFHKLTVCPTVGITGTRGKSTTTTLIYEILKRKFKDKMFLGGNIGKSAIRELDAFDKDDIAVLELSSFQLDGMGETKVSPHIAVITNIYKDHLDWHNDIDEYIETKKNIFKFQKKEDYLVINIDNDITRKFISEAKGKVITYSLKDKNADYYIDSKLNVFEKGKKLLTIQKPILQGEHNRYNMICSIATTRIYDISIKTNKEVIENFVGIPNRQEFVREIGGVKYFNDSCATSVEAIKAMFERFGKRYKGKIIMIGGGVDKGLEYEILLDNMKKYLKALILFEGTASEKIDEIVTPYVETYKYFSNMKEAIDQAEELSDKDDIVVLCPGASSFNMFKNEFDRGKQFVDYVNSL